MSDEVKNPQLRELVELARGRRTPAVTVTVDDVRRGVEADRSRSQGRLLAAAAAIAAVGLGWIYLAGSSAPVRTTVPSAPATAHVGPAQAGAATADQERVAVDAAPEGTAAPSQAIPAPRDPGTVVRDPAAPADVPVLAAGVVVAPLDGAAPPVIVSSWRVQVAAGRYRVETPAEGSALEVVVGRKIARVEPGASVTVGVDGTLEVHGGHAAWIDDRNADGGARKLSAQAERAMASGKRREAIRVLSRLVRKYPRSSQARAGLVDLARLHKASGSPTRARCAYALYLKRWPGAALRPEVERALAKLGPGPQCRGLSPK